MARTHAIAIAQAKQENEKQEKVVNLASACLTYFIPRFISLISPFYIKEPYHDSAFVQELLHGHRDRIKDILGVRLHVFVGLLEELTSLGYTHSRHVSLEEQLAIFLWMCHTGNCLRQVADRFQHSLETTSK